MEWEGHDLRERISADAGPRKQTAASGAEAPLLVRLRALALGALSRMYRPKERLFAFRVRRGEAGLVQEGVSRRYTAIALVGLAGETREAAAEVLAGARRTDVYERLAEDVGLVEDLGEVALTYWASRAIGDTDRAKVADRLVALRPGDLGRTTVEVAWTLTALSQGEDAGRLSAVRDRLARRLMDAFRPESATFSRTVPPSRGLRSHVSCFADLVYPIQALSHYHRVTGSRAALETAVRCAEALCARQGADGQWWWHYDVRSGRVIERYPVYAVHQDGMAPMALFALMAEVPVDFTAPIARGVRWLARAPELGGGTLLDDAAGVIWRKVARGGPRKLARCLQAAVSLAHPSLRVPGLDLALPPRRVDYECRPYHPGWLLCAWPADRARQWTEAGLL